jgi:hypothetical protein
MFNWMLNNNAATSIIGLCMFVIGLLTQLNNTAHIGIVSLVTAIVSGIGVGLFLAFGIMYLSGYDG